MIKFFKHQCAELEATESLTHVAYYHDMGLGKTFTGAEKMIRLNAKVNLVICQKSKIEDWVEHFVIYYENKEDAMIYDLTKWSKEDWKIFGKDSVFNDYHNRSKYILVINYELAWRRPELLKLKDFTLMLDESSLIQNEKSKRSRFILKLKPKNVILLSGTPTGGKYEKLWSQMHLLGWNISKKLFWQQYVEVDYLDNLGCSIPIVKGYKNVERLKRKMRQYGCRFLKTDDVFDLPVQNFNEIKIKASSEYRKFKKSKIVDIDGTKFIGDTTLKKMLCERMLCGSYNKDKLNAFRDILESTADRIIVFYSFKNDLTILKHIAKEYTDHLSIVNGDGRDLEAYEKYDDSVTFVQYKAGSMGINLQKANKLIYFTPPLECEFFEQSKKRIHRIGQTNPCFYYKLTVKGSIENKIYRTLELGKNYTEALYEEEVNE